MLYLIIGGSASGKSEYAEKTAVTRYRNAHKLLDRYEDKICAVHTDGPAFPYMGEQGGKLTYVAAMYPYDEECEKRIARHRSLRKNKGFQTVECYTHLEKLTAEKGDVLLIECMSNLLANEMYQESGSLGQNAAHSAGQENEIYNDGIQNDGIEIEMSEGSKTCAEKNSWKENDKEESIGEKNYRQESSREENDREENDREESCGEGNDRQENAREESCGEEYNRKENDGAGWSRLEQAGRKQLQEQDHEQYWQKKVGEVVINPIIALAKKASCVIVVTNDVFSEGAAYEEETKKYCRLLGYINRQLAREADGVVEVVCGIPIPVKGELPC